MGASAWQKIVLRHVRVGSGLLTQKMSIHDKHILWWAPSLCLTLKVMHVWGYLSSRAPIQDDSYGQLCLNETMTNTVRYLPIS